jgi:TPR repeat protein
MIWFQKAAEQRHPVAMLYLGVMYAEGRGVIPLQQSNVASVGIFGETLKRKTIDVRWRRGRHACSSQVL